MEENPGSENSSETAKSDTSNAEPPASTSAYQSFERYVSEQPARAILFAFVVGFTLALLLRR
jgi:ElaB/YqjD/DUF883 family membrane-anchored ribosome-binding protein